MISKSFVRRNPDGLDFAAAKPCNVSAELVDIRRAVFDHPALDHDLDALASDQHRMQSGLGLAKQIRGRGGDQVMSGRRVPAAPIHERAAIVEADTEAHAVDLEAQIRGDLRPGRAFERGVSEPVDLARVGDQVPDIRGQARVDHDVDFGPERIDVLRLNWAGIL